MLTVTIAYMAFLMILSSVPDVPGTGNPLEAVSPWVQNLLHMPAFGLLVLLLIITFHSRGLSEHRSIIFALTASTAYGAFTEIYQFWIPGRFPSVIDFIFDLAGILLFTVLFMLFMKGR